MTFVFYWYVLCRKSHSIPKHTPSGVIVSVASAPSIMGKFLSLCPTGKSKQTGILQSFTSECIIPYRVPPKPVCSFVSVNCPTMSAERCCSAPDNLSVYSIRSIRYTGSFISSINSIVPFWKMSYGVLMSECITDRLPPAIRPCAVPQMLSGCVPVE